MIPSSLRICRTVLKGTEFSVVCSTKDNYNTYYTWHFDIDVKTDRAYYHRFEIVPRGYPSTPTHVWTDGEFRYGKKVEQITERPEIPEVVREDLRQLLFFPVDGEGEKI